MIKNRHPKDAFWAIWLLCLVALLLCLAMSSGCTPSEPQFQYVTQQEREQMVLNQYRKDLHLPQGAKNIVKLDEEWHTFELVIDGRTRKFLRRTYGVLKGGQFNQATDTITELTPQ